MSDIIKKEVNVYTAHHVDSLDKKIPGASFGAVVVTSAGKHFRELYGPEDTYMTIWLKGVAEFMKELDQITQRNDRVELTLNVYAWHTNIQKICSKMSSVFRDLRDFPLDEKVERLIDRKLQRTNRTKYEHHDQQKEIVMALLSLNKKLRLIAKLKPLPPKEPNMLTAYQYAEEHMLDQVIPA